MQLPEYLLVAPSIDGKTAVIDSAGQNNVPNTARERAPDGQIPQKNKGADREQRP